ncbi:MAG: glycosyltransferase family 2 protein, partial [Natronosporangium sp.]
PAVRAELDRLGLVAVTQAKEVDDLRGYALSVAAARRAAIDGDAALRRTALATGPAAGALPLPGVSVVLSSMRADHIDACLEYLAGQTYPELEVLVGLHGYEVDDAQRHRWAERLRCPLRVVRFDAELPFGAVLGRLTRLAGGELVTKVDDDDHYGRHHVTDLVLAWHTSGADVVAKGARFVHFPELGQTIDRAWAAPELFNVTPAGGTILAGRGTLARIGGWSHSSKHVDEDLLIRVRSAGGLVYRTHALEYSYVRRTTGHTFDTRIDHLAEQGERVYPGLPRELIDPDPVQLDRTE